MSERQMTQEEFLAAVTSQAGFVFAIAPDGRVDIVRGLIFMALTYAEYFSDEPMDPGEQARLNHLIESLQQYKQ